MKHKSVIQHIFLLICIGFFSGLLFVKSQQNISLGVIPGIKINKPLPNHYLIDAELYTRLNLYQGTLGDKIGYDFNYTLTDITAYIDKIYNDKWTTEWGILGRFQAEGIGIRFIQGIEWKKKYTQWTFKQRLRFDQTFSDFKKPIFRTRYRLYGRFPIFEKKEEGKWFLVVSNEYVGIVNDNEFSLQGRLVPAIERKFSNQNVLDVGIDYRLDGFDNLQYSYHTIWVYFTYVIKL